jgi:hypothetical protein
MCGETKANPGCFLIDAVNLVRIACRVHSQFRPYICAAIVSVVLAFLAVMAFLALGLSSVGFLLGYQLFRFSRHSDLIGRSGHPGHGSYSI